MLGMTRNRTPALPSNVGWREFPVIPKLDAKKGLRSISMGGNKPNVFVGLDDGTAVVGFEDMSPLQVWDLATEGKLLRKFEGKGQECCAMIDLSGGRIAASWDNGSEHVVAVFDDNDRAGKRLQELTGFGKHVPGLALVDGHLLTMCADKTLRVWSQDAAGKFTEKATFETTSEPCGAMTVLSHSTIAMSMCEPTRIEVWNWKMGKCVRSVPGFGEDYVYAHSLLSDGRLVAGDRDLTIRVGSVDDWDAATKIAHWYDGLTGVLAGHDGSFVTTDEFGNIELWRNGACEVTLSGGCTGYCYYGVPLAVIGRRLIIVGDDDNLLVAE